MLRRTRFFLLGGIVATPVVAFITLSAALVFASELSEKNRDSLNDFLDTLRDVSK